ncbi:MAG: hypothetical protein HY773_02060 [Candidatus Terrybacteria bacterium]|nr:hypothetical protein [Candidatus Terrybacteria bacterium]
MKDLIIIIIAGFLMVIIVSKWLLQAVKEDDGLELKEQGIKCPRCGKNNLVGGVNLTIKNFFITVILRIPTTEKSYKIECKSCGHFWDGANIISSLKLKKMKRFGL